MYANMLNLPEVRAKMNTHTPDTQLMKFPEDLVICRQILSMNIYPNIYRRETGEDWVYTSGIVGARPLGRYHNGNGGTAANYTKVLRLSASSSRNTQF